MIADKRKILEDAKGFYYIRYDIRRKRKERVIKSECLNCHKIIYQHIGKGKGKETYCSHGCCPHPRGFKKDKSKLNMEGLKLGRAWNKGKKDYLSKESIQKMSKAHIGKYEEKSSHWKGGTTKEANKIKSRIEFKLWRKAVFERDNYTCQKCGTRGACLNAHHKKTFKEYPELRTCIENGITLCTECHKAEHKRMKLKVA